MSPAPRDVPAARRRTLPTILAILIVGAALTTGLVTACLRPGDDILPTPGSGGAAPAAGPAPLFGGWPAGKKPDVALILSGQQYSYLKFCGCSSPQLGGFERRYNFMQQLKARGWPLVAADLGDLVKYEGGIHDQSVLKYVTAMKALDILGYSAIGLGVDDFGLPLREGMAGYSYQPGNANPVILGANLDPKYRADNFPNLANGGSIIGDWAPVPVKGGPTVGIVSLIGADEMKKIVAKDAQVQFAKNNAAALASVLKEMDTAKVDLKFLLFQGSFAGATAIAKDHFPDKFDVILCLSEEDTPPSQADQVGKTMIVRVGWRGRFIGVVGAFRTGNANKPFDLYYQSVQLGEEYETAKGKEADNPVLKLLDSYATEVRSQDFLKRTIQRPITPPKGMENAKLEYIGSQACAGCHAADFALWQKSKHEHAFDALVKVANKPAQRQFDPECVSCHVTGLGLKSGCDGTPATRILRNVNCENCHGPGSLHAQAPKNTALKQAMSPWKDPNIPNDLLPTPAKLQMGIAAMTPAEQAIRLRVNDMCMKCHDIDNDPHFSFDKNWPQIIHGKNAKAPIPAPAAAAQNAPNK